MNLDSFSHLQLDAIREVGNIGAGNAATALSKLLEKPVEMDVPKAELISIYELGEHYGPAMSLVAAVFVRSHGDFPCSLIFIQEEENAQSLVDLLITKQFGGGMDVSSLPEEMRDSALSEVGNIILSSFLNAINMFVGSTYNISVPGVAHDMLAAVLDVVISIFGQTGDVALVVNTTLSVGESDLDVQGNVIMIPDPGSLEGLLEKLGVM
ncbi:MAG: chemotaxis protein CheC [Aminobacterium sp.]|jgi:chemotaxis protein CheC|nr:MULTISPECIES: chemotaxis protein CheC [unclassified Aminobacterium]MDD2207090.1 chemotaxis protein CheC [Aminobacterium sp.]MDD3426247.1 chemotaxis protein CheC [Aminobacterium sp.]MDD3707451.1 chemotaxis protein CheC [Aminobacterium sp.]MDD4228793.1 chemotaxis protein CheC [Aminobacterium sp.]MDD4550588.1 chemotaxis protein CheC [Aminobacterium sp.]